MAALTAIELGADSCVFVKAVVRRTEVRVAHAETLDPAAFPGPDTFVSALRQVRKTRRMPRRARVVLWGVPEGASPNDPVAAPLLAPLKKAGFRLDRVVSPCNALAALSRLRQPRHDAAVAWLAVNRRAVAIAVVRPGEQLFAHSFDWDSSVGATGSQARLLQRYSLVSFLAPELRRGIDAARAKGWRVDAVIMCGNLPDLRSLTMPLIEELDLEVETLDSLDGLVVKPAVKDALAESAPAIRIACAGAVARATRGAAASRQRFGGGALFRGAALIIAAAGIAWLWLSGHGTPPKPAPPAPAVRTKSAPAAQAPVVSASPKPATVTPPVVLPPVTKPPAVAPPATKQPAATPPAAKQPAVTPPQAQPAPVKQAAPASVVVPPKPAAAVAKTPAPPSKTPEPRPSSTGPPAQPQPPSAGPLRSQPAPADKVHAQPTRAVPLTDPIPRVTTILVSQERRFAMLDGGRVVSVGDTVGQRIVSSIEPRAIVLREPSGVQIRVGLGGRLIGVEKER